MDVASMIMGGSIVSVAWIALVPWTKLRRLKQLDELERQAAERRAGPPDAAAP